MPRRVRIETERLILRNLEGRDFSHLHAYRNDSEVAKY